MSVRGGVASDLEVGPLDAFAALGLQLGGLTEQVRKLRERDEQRALLLPQIEPITISQAADATGGATNPLFMDCQGPPPGRRWEVRMLAVGGVTFETAATGKVRVFVMPSQPIPLQDPPLTHLRDHNESLPWTANYGSGTFVVGEGDRLIVQIKSPTANQVYAVGGIAWSYATRIQGTEYQV